MATQQVPAPGPGGMRSPVRVAIGADAADRPVVGVSAGHLLACCWRSSPTRPTRRSPTATTTARPNTGRGGCLRNKPGYAGPRYFIRHAELDMYPLDAGGRRGVLRERQGLGLCNITKCCTEACPAGIKITDNAIIPMKERAADRRYDPLGRVVRSWRRREGRKPAS